MNGSTLTSGTLPSDPAMLVSFVNMKLRDEYVDGLDSLCDDLGIDRDELEGRLREAGFEYVASVNQFR